MSSMTDIRQPSLSGPRSARTGSRARLSHFLRDTRIVRRPSSPVAALFPGEQPTASTDWARDVADCSTDIFVRKHLAAHLRNSITSKKFAERNGSSVFL